MLDVSAFQDLPRLVATRLDLALNQDTTGRAESILNLIAAAGVGPVLPISLVAAALDGGDASTVTEVRDHVVSFGALITRGRPGTDQETLGIAHRSLLEPITDLLQRKGCRSPSAHRALVAAHRRLATTSDDTDLHLAVEEYWSTAAPLHHLYANDATAATSFLQARDDDCAADNRDRWASWVPTFAATLGDTHPDTVHARQMLGYWRGVAGSAFPEGPPQSNVVAPPAPGRQSAEPGTDTPSTPWFRRPPLLLGAGALIGLMVMLPFVVASNTGTAMNSVPSQRIQTVLTTTVNGTVTVVSTQTVPTTIRDTVTSTATTVATSTTVSTSTETSTSTTVSTSTTTSTTIVTSFTAVPSPAPGATPGPAPAAIPGAAQPVPVPVPADGSGSSGNGTCAGSAVGGSCVN